MKKIEENNIMSDTKICNDDFGSICVRKLAYRNKCLKVSDSNSGQCIYPCNNYSTYNCEEELYRGYKVYFIKKNILTLSFRFLQFQIQLCEIWKCTFHKDPEVSSGAAETPGAVDSSGTGETTGYSLLVITLLSILFCVLLLIFGVVCFVKKRARDSKSNQF